MAGITNYDTNVIVDFNEPVNCIEDSEVYAAFTLEWEGQNRLNGKVQKNIVNFTKSKRLSPTSFMLSCDFKNEKIDDDLSTFRNANSTAVIKYDRANGSLYGATPESIVQTQTFKIELSNLSPFKNVELHESVSSRNELNANPVTGLIEKIISSNISPDRDIVLSINTLTVSTFNADVELTGQIKP